MAMFDTDRARIFQTDFDAFCKLAFTNCFSKFYDYTVPILHTSDFTNFQNQSKKIFSEEWTFLSLHRNVNEDRDGPVLAAFKERQVFITILLLLRQSNFCCYELSEVIVPNMDDHVFNKEDEGEAMENEDDNIGQNQTNLCVTKLYKDGWREINQSKVREVRQVACDRVIRKRDVTKYIMKQVKEMKTKSSTMVVCCKNAMVEVSSWSSYMHVLRPTYY